MTAVKRMTSKKDFLGIPLKDRNCEAELYEDCKTRKLLEECNCVPWEMPGYEVNNSFKASIKETSQGMEKCSPRGRDCIEEFATHSINCQTSCDGIYADGEQQKDENFQDMTKHLMEHYEIFKRKNVKHFRFNSTANSTMFGM